MNGIILIVTRGHSFFEWLRKTRKVWPECLHRYKVRSFLSRMRIFIRGDIDHCSRKITRRGGSNEYPQSMLFSAEIRKLMYTPVNLSFTV